MRKAIGDVQQFRKDMQAALASYEEALGLFRAVGSRLGEATVLQAMGLLAARKGEYEQALALLTEAYRLYQQIQNDYSQSVALYYRSLVYEATSAYCEAAADMQGAVDIARQIDLPWLDEWSARLGALQKQCSG